MFDQSGSTDGLSTSITTHGNKKWPMGLIVAIVVLIGAGFGFYYITTIAKSPTNVAKGFVKKLSKNDLKSAYEMTARQFQTTVTVTDLEKFLIQYPILISVSSMKFKFKDENNDVATVSGEIGGKDGNISPITLVIVKENNKWKILNLSLNPKDIPREISGEKK